MIILNIFKNTVILVGKGKVNSIWIIPKDKLYLIVFLISWGIILFYFLFYFTGSF